MAKVPGNYLLSCDWGTSSFRLRLLERSTGRSLAETSATEGIPAVHRRWEDGQTASRADFYREVLHKYLEILSADVPFSITGIPLVISGMASSSLGLKELPYAHLPFSLDGGGTVTGRLEASAGFPHEILLISGVKSSTDVMRGEETQLLGLAAMPPGAMNDAVFIFPGTHSKHAYVRGEALVSFKTYVTGEMFRLLATHSILRETVDGARETAGDRGETAGNQGETVAGRGEVSDRDLAAFRLGLHHPEGENLLHSVFSVRTNYLFGKLDKGRNFYCLSGLVIGAELRGLRRERAKAVVLCGGSNLSGFYELALRELKLPGSIIVIPPETADLAASFGHLVLARRYLT